MYFLFCPISSFFFLHNDITFLPPVLLCRSKSACGFWSMPFKICSVISSLSPGMLQTAEDPVTLEKVDQGEEMPLSCLVMYACVSVCAQENTHTHCMYRLVLTLHSHKHRWSLSMQLFLWTHTHTHTVSGVFFWRIHISLLADNGQCWWLRRSLTPHGGFDVIPRVDNLSLLLLQSWNANFSLYLISLFGQPNADYSESSILALWQSLTFKHSDRFSHCSLSKMLKFF